MTTAPEPTVFPEWMRDQVILKLRETAHAVSVAMDPIDMQYWDFQDLLELGDTLVALTDFVYNANETAHQARLTAECESGKIVS